MRSLYPNAGNIHIEGHSVLSQFNFAARHLGVVTQHNTLWDRLSCLDHLRLFARLRGVAPNDIELIDVLSRLSYGRPSNGASRLRISRIKGVLFPPARFLPLLRMMSSAVLAPCRLVDVSLKSNMESSPDSCMESEGRLGKTDPVSEMSAGLPFMALTVFFGEPLISSDAESRAL